MRYYPVLYYIKQYLEVLTVKMCRAPILSALRHLATIKDDSSAGVCVRACDCTRSVGSGADKVSLEGQAELLQSDGALGG